MNHNLGTIFQTVGALKAALRIIDDAGVPSCAPALNDVSRNLANIIANLSLEARCTEAIVNAQPNDDPDEVVAYQIYCAGGGKQPWEGRTNSLDYLMTISAYRAGKKAR